MFAERLKELAAIALIGDGVVGFAAPRRHSLLWKSGPAGYAETVEWFAKHPDLVRVLAAAEVFGGLWLALRQYPRS